MTTKTALSPRLYFSYSQFMVYDGSVQLPGCEWTEEHTAQGFARRKSVANFNTLLEFGDADVAVKREAYQPQQEYQRVIVVPFRVTS
jgi:Competence protein J (ComJ)